MSAELTVIMVSYNTRELTLIALETLLEKAGNVSMDIVLWDNASSDGSADAVAERFPDIKLVRSAENLGFAAANNAAAAGTVSPWLLLLNPDTETHPGAVEKLLDFARAHPEAGIVGGRTVFADGSLNIASCWNKMTVWSLLCRATGLSRVFSASRMFNPEAIGGWKRDTVREVDIVVGCFLLTSRELWERLGGFRDKYFMFGEEVDLCLRAAELGYRPMITPEAQIVHHVGASYAASEERIVKVLKGQVTIIRDHWGALRAPLGIGLLLVWAGLRSLARSVARNRARRENGTDPWISVWNRRREWLAGY
ncbi:MAG: glycosyltransferase family 2 protein [Erythrobacter sp.]|jgi:GT2 family glycosyltransferase|nr:glycosyltransferase family 2 protein [Erythrobacter sp.]